MPVRCDVALFAPRHRFELGDVALPGDRGVLERAVESALPQMAEAVDGKEHVVFSGAEAEVTVRAVDGGYALDVDSADGTFVERGAGGGRRGTGKDSRTEVISCLVEGGMLSYQSA